MKNNALILCVTVFLVLMGILAYVEFVLSTPRGAAEQDQTTATVEMPVMKEVPTAAENEIHAILNTYYELARTNNRAALINYSREIVAPEYRYTSELGTLDKETAISLPDSMNVEFVSADFDSFEVQVLGSSAAVAKYRDISKVRTNGGAEKRTPMRFTSVWERRDGRWLVVAEHSSVLAPPKLLPRQPLADNMAQNISQ